MMSVSRIGQKDFGFEHDPPTHHARGSRSQRIWRERDQSLALSANNSVTDGLRSCRVPRDLPRVFPIKAD